MLFNKALFKQSIKANGLSWLIITVMNVFMLACVMCIAGSDQLSDLVEQVSGTIVDGEISGAIVNGSINYYRLERQSCEIYDKEFVLDYKVTKQKLDDYKPFKDHEPLRSEYTTDEEYNVAHQKWKDGYDVTVKIDNAITDWKKLEPVKGDNLSPKELEEYNKAYQKWMENKPTFESLVAKDAAKKAILKITPKLDQFANTKIKEYNLEKYQGGVGADIVRNVTRIAGVAPIYFNEKCQELYDVQNLPYPEQYDYKSLITHVNDGDIEEYLQKDRYKYIQERSQDITCNLVSSLMTRDETIFAIVVVLAEYNFTAAQYERMGYQNFFKVHNVSSLSVVSYESQYKYQLTAVRDSTIRERNIEKNKLTKSLNEYTTKRDEATSDSIKQRYQALIDDIQADLATFDDKTENIIQNKLAKVDEELTDKCTKSFLTSLPKDVAATLEESGTMDAYALIVANVYFKVSGLLLPIIYVVITSNNLIAGSVDKGSMAYVLSTGTKRESVTFTQAMYLISSIFLMYLATYITSVICFAIVHNSIVTHLTFFKLFLLNAGSFLALFALSGICFYCSCQFNRSKYAVGVGGGFSIFSLVATILGLFGTKVIPSMVRFNSLNYFNYVSLISLFDIFAITDMEKIEAAGQCPAFWWEGPILLVIGIIFYIAGNIVFKKKDLPL